MLMRLKMVNFPFYSYSTVLDTRIYSILQYLEIQGETQK